MLRQGSRSNASSWVGNRQYLPSYHEHLSRQIGDLRHGFVNFGRLNEPGRAFCFRIILSTHVKKSGAIISLPDRECRLPTRGARPTLKPILPYAKNPIRSLAYIKQET
jgi:hypothetical protein